MKKNAYEVSKNVEKLLNGKYTGFINNKMMLDITSRLKKGQYNIFSPFDEAEKIILYAKEKPVIRLFKINCYKDDELKHSSIMGSLFGINITSEMFGDIIKYDNYFYVYLLGSISDFVCNNLDMVGNVPVTLEEVDIDLLEGFQREYEEIEMIVSSLRIDTVISRLIGSNRDAIGEKAKNQEIILNDDIVKKVSNTLKDEDIFSIKRYGKFKFKEIINRTKKNNFIIRINKYL